VGVVIIDPEGRIAWRGGDPHKPNDYYVVPDRQLLPFVALKEHLERHLDKGLLGGLAVPERARPVVEALQAGRLALAQARLAKLETGGFEKSLRERLEALRRRKRSRFDDLVRSGDGWGAFKVGQSYLRCFPGAGDVRAVEDAVRTLRARPGVTENLAAREAFAKIVADDGRKEGGPDAKTRPGLQGVAERYPDTEFGRYAAGLPE
jgi:hypothetical protein